MIRTERTSTIKGVKVELPFMQWENLEEYRDTCSDKERIPDAVLLGVLQQAHRTGSDSAGRSKITAFLDAGGKVGSPEWDAVLLEAQEASLEYLHGLGSRKIGGTPKKVSNEMGAELADTVASAGGVEAFLDAVPMDVVAELLRKHLAGK